MPNLLPIALLMAGMFSVQVGASIAKTMFPVTGPVGMVALRIGLGTLMLCAALRPWRVRVTRSSIRALLVYGASLGIMNLFYYMALARIPLGIAVAIEFLGPLTVAVMSSRRLADFCWIVLAVAGLLLLLPMGQTSGGIDPVGILYALLAGVCWGLYIISGQKTGADLGTRSVAWGSLISALIIVPLGFADRGLTLLSGPVLMPALAVALFSTAIPYTAEMFVLTRMPARTFGVLMSLEPAFGAVIGFVYLHEALTALQWTAIALVIVASAGATACAQGKLPVETQV